jgi:hypothetical protein
VGFRRTGAPSSFSNFWTVEARVTVARTVAAWEFSNLALSILIFNWNPPFADFLIFPLLLNCFSKIPLSKLYQNLLKNCLKYNKIYGNFYLPFCPLVKHQLIFNA